MCVFWSASICLSTTTCLHLSVHHYLPPSVCPPLPASICLSTTTCLHLSVHHHCLICLSTTTASICLSTTTCLHLSVHHYLPSSVCPPPLPPSVCPPPLPPSVCPPPLPPSVCPPPLSVQTRVLTLCSLSGDADAFSPASVGVFGEKSGLLPWVFRLPWGFGYWTDDCIEAVMVLMFWQ